MQHNRYLSLLLALALSLCVPAFAAGSDALTRGKGFQGMWMFRLDYPDADKISAYADEAMHWAVMHKLLTDTGKGLEPQAPVTEAQLLS